MAMADVCIEKLCPVNSGRVWCIVVAAGALAMAGTTGAGAFPQEGPLGLLFGLPALLLGFPELSLSLLLERMDIISTAASLPMGIASQSPK